MTGGVSGTSSVGHCVDEDQGPAFGLPKGTNMDTHTITERLQSLLGNDHTVALMESCTGGLLASAITDIPGSGYLLASAVCYDVGAKIALGVPEERISKFGVVSQEVASDMAQAAAELFHAEYGVSTTGVAGPGPDGEVPAGTVWLGVRLPTGETVTRLLDLHGDREQIKDEAVRQACLFLLEVLEDGE